MVSARAATTVDGIELPEAHHWLAFGYKIICALRRGCLTECRRNCVLTFAHSLPVQCACAGKPKIVHTRTIPTTEMHTGGRPMYLGFCGMTPIVLQHNVLS